MLLTSCNSLVKINNFCYNCKIERNFIEILFDFCQNPVKMSAIPQGALHALKLKNANKPILEYTPVKYNSKLMKSIWGLYNRYSPHNIKKNTDVQENGYFSSQQQQFVVAAYAISKNLGMKKDENIWKF